MTTKGDRVLVWLTMFTLVFGGLGATVAVFFSDVVMARRHPPPQAEPVKPSGTTSSTLEGTGIIVTSGSLLDGLRPGEWIAEAQSRLGSTKGVFLKPAEALKELSRQSTKNLVKDKAAR